MKKRSRQPRGTDTGGFVCTRASAWSGGASEGLPSSSKGVASPKLCQGRLRFRSQLCRPFCLCSLLTWKGVGWSRGLHEMILLPCREVIAALTVDEFTFHPCLR